MLFNDAIPKEVYDTVNDVNIPESVIILDFYCIFSYLRPVLSSIDYFVLVTCDEQTQLQRLTDPKLRNISEDLAKKRIEVNFIFYHYKIK